VQRGIPSGQRPRTTETNLAWLGYALFHAPHAPSYYLRRLYYDTVTYDVEALKLAYDLAGPERLLYDSDYPHQRSVAPSAAMPICDSKACCCG
jgi:predicted TIM-barrel fold metal-dependent hydrolase